MRQDLERLVDEQREKDAFMAQCVAGTLVRDGKVLLVKRLAQKRFYPDMWDLFGGHVEE